MEGLAQAIEKQGAIGEIRQRVVEGPVLERGLHSAAFGDVAHDRHGVSADRAKGDLDRDDRAVLAAQAEVLGAVAHEPRRAPAVEAAAVAHMDAAQPLRDEGLDGLADQRPALVSGHRLGGAVDEDYVALVVGDHHGVRDCFEDVVFAGHDFHLAPAVIWRPPKGALAPGSVPSGLLAILALSGGRVLVNPRHLSRGGVLEHFSGRPERTLFMSTVSTIPQEVTDDREDRDDHEGDDVLYEAHGWERSTMAAVP